MYKYLKYMFEFLLSFVIVQLFLGIVWFTHSFVETPAEGKFFTVLAPLNGAPGEFVLNYILWSVIPGIVLAIGILIFIRKIDKKWIYVPLLVVGLSFAFYKLGIFEYVFVNSMSSNFIKENYVNPSDVNIEFTNKKNLIYIILESVENTYAAKEDGGFMKDSLIPNLTKMANDNISFSDTNKLGGGLYLDGTSFTTASILAQMSGVPLKLDIDKINKYDFKKFYEGITLGDILYENGYENYVIMGSNSEFGAIDGLYKNHHYNVSDLNTAIAKGKMTQDDIVWWGYSDSDLFKYAKEELLEISKNGKPFNYIINTMNTHFKDGYVEKDCENIFEDQYSNVVYNSDSMVSDFVDWVKKQDFYENTVIVIVGDHITMDLKFCNSLPKNYNRTTYNTFINTDFDKMTIKNNKRLFTQLDMFPTTISAIGGKIEGDRLGLGTNLFSGKETIIEKYGYENVQLELNRKSKFLSSLMGKK